MGRVWPSSLVSANVHVLSQSGIVSVDFVQFDPQFRLISCLNKCYVLSLQMYHDCFNRFDHTELHRSKCNSNFSVIYCVRLATHLTVLSPICPPQGSEGCDRIWVLLHLIIYPTVWRRSGCLPVATANDSEWAGMLQQPDWWIIKKKNRLIPGVGSPLLVKKEENQSMCVASLKHWTFPNSLNLTKTEQMSCRWEKCSFPINLKEATMDQLSPSLLPPSF